MPDVVIRTQPAFNANVGNRSISARPSIGQPTGPRGIPCAVLCPPPPPTDLAIVTVKVWAADPSYLQFTFDAPFYLDGTEPNWTVTERPTYDPGAPDVFGSLNANVVNGGAGPAQAGDHLVIPPNSGGFRSLSGGHVAAGTYVVAAA